MLECMIIHYMDGTLSQVFKFLCGIMPEVIVLHGFLVLTMFYVTASSFSTNDQQLIAAYLLPSIYPSSRRLMCPEATYICPGKQMNVRIRKQMRIQCLSHKDCASQKICCWSNCWSKYSCQDPVFIVKIEGHSEHLQEDFQTNVNGKYEIALPCETCNEALTAQTWTYSANDGILEIRDEHSKVKRAATTNTPKAKKKSKPTVTKTNKKRAKNIKTVPKITKKSAPAKSKKEKRKKTTTKTAKKKHSKSKKKTLKSTAKKSVKPTKQITINAKTSKTMENSDETERKKIIKTKPTNEMALTTVQRVQPTNETALTTVKRTKPTKKMALTTVKMKKTAYKKALTIVRSTNPTTKIALTTVKRAKTTKETIPSATKEVPSMKATQNHSTKNFYGLFKIKTKQKNPENREVLGSTNKLPLLQDFNNNIFMEKYQGVFRIKSKTNEVKSTGKLFKSEEEQNSRTEIVTRTKLTKKTALITVTKHTNKMTMKTRKRTKPTKKMTLTTIKIEKPTNKTTLTTVRKTRPTKEMALSTVSKAKPTNKMALTIVKRTKPTNKTILTTVKRIKPTKKMSLTTVKRTKPTVETILSVTKEKIPAVEKTTQNNSTKNFYEQFKIKTKQKIPENGEVLGSTKKFPLLQDFNENTIMDKYQRAFPIKSRTNEVDLTGKLFKLEEEQNSTKEILKRTKLTNKMVLTTVTKPTNKITIKTIKKTKPTNKMKLTTIKIAKPTNKTSMTTVKKTRPTKKMVLTTVKKVKPTNKMTLTIIKRRKPTNKTTLITVKRTKPTKKMSLTTVKRTKPTVETFLSVTKENIPAVEKATQNNSSKNFYGPFKIKKKQKLSENVEVLGTTTRMFSLLQEFRGNTFVDKYQGVYRVKPRKNEAISTGKLFKLEEQRNHTRETVKRTKPTKELEIKPTKKTSQTAVKRPKPTTKMALATVKRTKPTKEKISTVPKEEIPVVEKVTQNNSTKNFYGLFKIKTKQKIPQNGEVLGSTKKLTLLQDFNEDTFMDKYQGVFPIKSRTNEVISTGKLFKLEEQQNSATEIVKRTKLTKKTALTTVTKSTNKMTMKTIKKTKSTNKMTLTTIKIAKPTNKTAMTTVRRSKPTKKMFLTTVKRTKPTVETLLSVSQENISAVEKATQSNSSKNVYGPFKIKKKQKLPENGEVLGTKTRTFSPLQEFRGNTFVDKYQGVYPVKPRKNEASSTGKLFNLEEQRNHTRKTVKRTKPTKKLATKPIKKTSLTAVKRTKPTKKMALATIKRTKPAKEIISMVKKEEIPVDEKVTQNNSTKNFYGLFKIKTKQNIPQNGEVLGSTEKFPLLQDFNKNTFMDKYQGVFPIKSRTNEVNSTGRLFKLEEEQNSTTEVVKRTKLTKKTTLTTVTKPINKMTMRSIKRTNPPNKMTLTTLKIAKQTHKTALTNVKKTRPTKKMALITVKRTKPTVETILSVTKENIPAVEKATQNNSSKNFYGPFKIKKKQKLPENGEVLGTTTRKFSLLQEFRGNTFVDKYQGVYPVKPRKNEAISTGKLFNLEEQRNHTRETVKRTKTTKKLVTKPTKKTSRTAVKRTKPTKKMAPVTLKRTKPTKETISTVAKEEIPVVEKVTQYNSTKNFYGLFKIKTKQKLPEYSEVLVTTIRNFPPLPESNGNTLMSKYQGFFTLLLLLMIWPVLWTR